MTKLETQVLVVGGGATGVGVAYDAALRGFDVTLVDRADLAEGTSGRFHGLLHSGARYAVKDPRSAGECMQENAILRRIAPHAIEDTGGLFVTTPWDDPVYGDDLVAGCGRSGIPIEELSIPDVLAGEPRLNPRIRRAFRVPDASIDVWTLVWSCARAVEQRGGRVLTRHRVVDVLRDDDRVAGARVRDERAGSDVDVRAEFVVNASGAWAGQIASMAGCRDVTILPGKGIMIAMNHRLVHAVINRCEMPADGDIIVPIRTVSVIGTTDERVAHPDDLRVTRAEVDQMLDDGEKLVPGFRQGRALRVWAGVRPLFKHDEGEVSSTRDVSRSHALLDHRARDGIEGFLTITGGKLTTFRRMAEDTVDAMCAQMGVARPCTTATRPLPGAESSDHLWVGARLAHREHVAPDAQLVCECELVDRSALEREAERGRATDLDDIRRTLRLGMGPCQGGFCTYRAAGVLHAMGRLDRDAANRALLGFVQERWKGVQPILYGDGLRQARLDEWIFQGVLDVERLAP